MEEKRVDSSSTKEIILGILSAAPVTNDRCANDNEVECYAFLRELLMEESRALTTRMPVRGPLNDG